MIAMIDLLTIPQLLGIGLVGSLALLTVIGYIE